MTTINTVTTSSFDYAELVPNAETADAIRQGREDYEAGRLTGYKPSELFDALSYSTGD